MSGGTITQTLREAEIRLSELRVGNSIYDNIKKRHIYVTRDFF